MNIPEPILNPLPQNLQGEFQRMLGSLYNEFVIQVQKLHEACSEADWFYHIEYDDNFFDIEKHIIREHDRYTLELNIIYAKDWYDRIIKENHFNNDDPSIKHMGEALNAIQDIVDSL